MGTISNWMMGGQMMMQGAGMGMNMAAAQQQQKADNLARKWDATIARQDSELARASAAQTRKRGEIAAGETRLEAVKLKGQQRAAYGASGVDVNWGSAADVQADTMAWGEYSAQKELYNYGMEAWQQEVNANRLDSEARRLEAGIGSTSVGVASAAITGLTGMFQTANAWKKY